ncbi:DNA alkylation repair protein [Caloranaerobacter sp. TR13]|uniref:DNA alkylation repair protein n=1 Tax=Caloranaerobacter sp. TR13 TaxID=1302151 RepID=UPI0006D418B3|nr:DNA alkylation repair protein [Caloranaerobacter sp. TR13]KPU27566.1 DNA alkylation repair protein [Caloranaerobacter sp. TR13]
MDKVKAIKNELSKYIDEEKAKYLPNFFKAFPGGYGEGDKFIGVAVPNQRKVAKKFKDLSLNEIQKLLNEDIHEYRLTALFILVHKFQKSDNIGKKEIVDFYIKNINRVNNWDLVDSTAYKILGPYLIDKDKSLLYDFAKTDHLWKQRISIVTTYYFIKNGKYEDTLKISKLLLDHKHDLIHKAVGWMLREIGNRDKEVEVEFLKKYYKKMPRTMLRYAIEKFDKEERTKYLKGEI